jgi:hypothetical protein
MQCLTSQKFTVGGRDAVLARCVAGALSIARPDRHGRRVGPDGLSHSIRDVSGRNTVEADFMRRTGGCEEARLETFPLSFLSLHS